MTPDTSTATTAAPPEALELDEDEQELVTLDVDALLPTLDADRRERFAALRDAVVAGCVPAELLAPLESLLELTLQTARARARYRAEGEQTLTKLYRRTPAGRGLSRHLGQVNDALATLAGQEITSLSVAMRTVGHFTLTIQTSETTMTLAARPDTIDVESISVSN